MNETELHRSSPSQVKTYELCHRKWAWDKIDKVPRQANKFSHKGTLTHTQIQEFYVERRTPAFHSPDPDQRHAAELAMAIVQHLPPPQTPGIEIEKYGELVFEDIVFRMFIDFAIYDIDVPLISDHKTTSDFAWALTEESIISDAQATLYALYGMVRTGKPEVDLQWTYAKTRGAATSQPVRRRVNLPMIQPRIDQTILAAREMKLIKQQPGITALDVPYDASACAAFGGCPYNELCNLSPKEKVRSIMSQEATKNDFMAKLKARQAEQNSATPHPPPATPQPVNPPAAPVASPVASPAPPAPEPAKAPPKAGNGKKTQGKPKKTQPEPVAAPTPAPQPVAVAGKGYEAGFEAGFAMAIRMLQSGKIQLG